jgi:16S rRNA (cytosine967-C5)-methyltransferase
LANNVDAPKKVSAPANAAPKPNQRAPISPARREAQAILLRVERDSAYASELLNAPSMEKLSREDRSLTYELVMTTLRWQSVLDAAIARYSSQKLKRLDVEVLTALRLAACQLLRLSRIPAHAAVHESVELVKQSGKRSAAPFANAVLRKLVAEAKSAQDANFASGDSAPHDSTQHSAAALAAEFAHPEWLVLRWIDMYGYVTARAICQAGQLAPPQALRLAAPEVEAELAAAGVTLAPGLLLRSARRVETGDLIHSEAFRTGRVAIQDEASQLLAALVAIPVVPPAAIPDNATRILDCCAAPGGKTSAIAARLPQAHITAVELYPHRARLLRQRVPATVEIIEGDIRELKFDAPFDAILADVPCSGTGTLSAHPEIKWRLQAGDLPGLQDLQLSILQAAARWLAPGGRLIYSTCSLEPEEGEEVIEKFLAAATGFAVVGCPSILDELRRSGELTWQGAPLTRGPYLRTLPGPLPELQNAALHNSEPNTQPCDGFFAAVLTRL